MESKIQLWHAQQIERKFTSHGDYYVATVHNGAQGRWYHDEVDAQAELVDHRVSCETCKALA